MSMEEMEAGTPPEQVTAEQGAVEVEQQATPEATTEQTQEQQGKGKDQEPKKVPWFQHRIGEVTKEKYQALSRAEQAEARLAQLEQQLSSGVQPNEQNQHVRPLTQAEIDRLADERASQLVAQKDLVSATDRVWQSGTKELQGFEQAVNNLAMAGMDANFVQLAVESPDAHKVIHYLGQEANLDEAARILHMSPVQQARELTRLEIKLSQPPAPKPVSKAPEPIKPVGTGNATESGIRDDLPMEEWMRRRRESLRKT
jgi:hypothetical protein